MSTNYPDIINHRYVLHDKIGEGSCGEVFRAKDRLTGETVALKRVSIPTEQLLFASRGHQENLQLALAQEFRTLASLRHPHIISVLDYGFSQNKQPYFTMELLETPKTVLTAGEGQSLEAQVDLLIELLQALVYLHRRAILHRDLKPANILVTELGKVKVLDFGLSTTVEQSKGAKGTLLYMSPEVLQGLQLDSSADIFAVGIIAYQLVTGRYPFDQSSANHIISSILYDSPNLDPIDDPLLADVLMTCLEKNVAHRYGSAEDVIQALSHAIENEIPSESIAIRESFLQTAAFIGRETELATLVTALDDAMQGNGSSWLVGGESGIGKSRLIDELQTHALVEGAIVLRGQAVDEGGLPYQLWRDPLRRLLLSSDLSDLEASILKEIVPDIAQLLDKDVADAPELEGNAWILRLNLTIADIFKRQTQPIILLLEDLQWAKEEISTLKQLNSITKDSPLLIVSTYRNDERPNLPDELLGTQFIRLERFTEDNIMTLSTSMLGENGQHADVLDLLNKETEGNVFFLVEVVRALAEEAGSLSNVGTITLPEDVFTGGIDRILQRRLRKVPKQLQSLLKFSAIIGREINRNILKHRYTTEEVDTLLMVCANIAILDVQDNRWRFAHDKLRQAVLQSIPDNERQQLHRTAAEAIEAVYPENSDYNEALLEHWHQADDLDKEIHYLNLVARYLINIKADYAYARDLIKRGLQMLADDDARRLPLLGEQTQSYLRQGNYEQVKKISLQTLDLLEKVGDADNTFKAMISNFLGAAAQEQGEHQQATDYFSESLAIWETIDSDKGMRMTCSCLGNLGHISFARGDFKKAESYFQQAYTLQKNISDQHVTAISLGNVGLLHMIKKEYEQANRNMLETLAIQRGIGDISGISYSLSNLGLASIHQGRHQDAFDYLQESLTIKEKIGDQLGMSYALSNMAMAMYKQGHYEQAENYYQQSISIKRDIKAQYGLAYSLNHLGFVYIRINEHQQAERTFSEALSIADAIKSASVVLESILGFAWLHLNNGDIAYAGELLGLAQNHPASSVEVQDRLDEMMPLLENALSPDDMKSAIENGKALELGSIVKQILAEGF